MCVCLDVSCLCACLLCVCVDVLCLCACLLCVCVHICVCLRDRDLIRISGICL